MNASQNKFNFNKWLHHPVFCQLLILLDLCLYVLHPPHCLYMHICMCQISILNLFFTLTHFRLPFSTWLDFLKIFFFFLATAQRSFFCFSAVTLQPLRAPPAHVQDYTSGLESHFTLSHVFFFLLYSSFPKMHNFVGTQLPLSREICAYSVYTNAHTYQPVYTLSHCSAVHPVKRFAKV